MINAVKDIAKQMKVTKKRLCFAFGTCICLFAILAILSRYFERSDFLKPVNVVKKKNIADKCSDGNIPSLGIVPRKQYKSPWDKWMEENSNLQSIGDIWDKCDNRTRMKIGKFVLENVDGGAGVKIVMLLNMTFAHEVTGGKIDFTVHFNEMILHEKEYDFCEECADLKNPLYCPFAKGYKVRLRTVLKLPSYIPKGHYVMFSRIKDQNGQEIGCINAEVMTGK